MLIHLSRSLLGAKAVDQSIDLARLVADSMKPQVDQATTSCLGELANLPQLSPGQYLNLGPDADKLLNYVRDQDPSQLTGHVGPDLAGAARRVLGRHSDGRAKR